MTILQTFLMCCKCENAVQVKTGMPFTSGVVVAATSGPRHISVDANKHQPTFNIESSSNRSKDAQNGGASSSKVTSPPSPQETVPSAVKVAHSQSRKIVVSSSAFSKFETGSDSSWCSEEMSVEDNEKAKADTRLWDAALEAQRERDMFAKVPKQSYSNLDHSRPVLSTLLNPGPNIFLPKHLYQSSHSSQDVTQLPRRSVLPGFPQSQEIEYDSDSGEDNPDNRIQVSQSVVQERLAALAG